MQAQFLALIDELRAQEALPATAAAATCPSEPQQIVPKLLDLGVAPAALSRALGKVFHCPVYAEATHGRLAHSGARGEWGYAAGVLFLACPFDRSLQPAVLLPEEARRAFKGFGVLPVAGAEAGGDDGYALARAERVICRWLERAAELGATDIHVAPLTANYVRVRVRVDGRLQTLDEFPLKVQADASASGEGAGGEGAQYRFISNMILKMAGCQSGSFTRPLDGRFERKLGGRRLTVRMAMRPVAVQSVASQAFFLRLLGDHSAARPATVEALDLAPEAANFFAALRRLPQGLVLMTGPTGSGKSTTLYANLAQIAADEPWRSIQTLEDPVERNIEGLVQTQINEAAGMSFHDGLRALMRNDVDIILVGEIRDPQTAALAVRASLTGHLVFATVHAKSAPAVVGRMRDLGVGARPLAAVLAAAAAQRLLRRVCPHCSRAAPADAVAPPGLFAPGDTARVASPEGCARCDGGYAGRALLVECLRFDRRLAAAVAADAPPDDGGAGLWRAAARLVASHKTTLEECRRQLPAFEPQPAADMPDFTAYPTHPTHLTGGSLDATQLTAPSRRVMEDS